MWKICILLVKCASSPFPQGTQKTNPSINHDQNMSDRSQNCKEFKTSLLDIPRHRFYTSLHENVEIAKSEKKGHFARIIKNTHAFNILGVEVPITSIEFDPLEYQWRRLPTSFERYISTNKYIMHIMMYVKITVRL